MSNQQPLRQHLVKLLQGGQSYMPLQEQITGIPMEAAGKKVEGLPYTIYQLMEHIRISQHDLLDFSRNPEYQYIKWPDDYWPDSESPTSAEEWEQTVQSILDDREEMIELVQDESRDLLEPFPWGKGQTLLREAMLMAEHNAYHAGQIVLMRRLLRVWE